MKQFTLIILAITFTFWSCKKEQKSQPTPTTPSSTTTYSNFTVSIGLIDNTGSGWPGVYSSGVKKAIVRCGGVPLDSVVGINVTADATGVDPCSMASLDTVTRNFKIQDGATNYIDIYDGAQLISTAEVVRSPTNKINVTFTDPNVSCYNIPGCPILYVPIK